MFQKSNKAENNAGGILAKTNRIVEGTQIKGDIVSENDFRLDGTLIGNCTIKGKLVIGPTGSIEGEIKCQNLDIEGKFVGKLYVKELLNLKATANVKGEAFIGKLGVEAGAMFTATCSMQNDVKTLVSEAKQA